MNELISRFRLALKTWFPRYTSTGSPLTASISNSIRQEIDSLFIFDFPQDCSLVHRTLCKKVARISRVVLEGIWLVVETLSNPSTRLRKNFWEEGILRFTFVTIECINFELDNCHLSVIRGGIISCWLERRKRREVKGYADERPRSSDFYFSDIDGFRVIYIPTRLKTNLFLFPPDWSIVA